LQPCQQKCNTEHCRKRAANIWKDLDLQNMCRHRTSALAQQLYVIYAESFAGQFSENFNDLIWLGKLTSLYNVDIFVLLLQL
jgi:hypothetical protein